MAKQSGIHQIKGKIGEHSYYRQTGVSGGLIRSINQGLSERVKKDAAYANTRLNNQEFGAAANVAALLGQMVTPKFRPMILPFSQSRMAKEVLRLARENADLWGQRTVSSSQTAKLAATLAAQSKRNAAEFATLFVDYASGNDFEANINYSSAQAALMASLGITGLSVSVISYNLATGNWNPLAQQMMTGYLEKVDSSDVDIPTIDPTGEDNTETVTVPSFTPASGHTGHQIVVFVVLPYRAINNVNHILQEYCSFTAVELPARA